MADQLVQSGAYIPSVRPGKGTEKYISSLLIRLSTVGSLFLGVISIVPIIAQNIWGLPKIVALGGTSLLIVIMTAIQGVDQLEGYMLKKKYTGFMDSPINDY
jgi:preprotein translocase subunit SecY